MISGTINRKIIEAMKAKDRVKLSTLKMLSSALHNAEIDKRGNLTEEEELVIVRREAKKRKDAIEAYQKADRVDLAEKEKEELKILQEFLPKELGDEELEKLVDDSIKEVNAKGMADIGKVMGKVMAKVSGRADGKRVSDMVRKKLK
jgi:hypothetical protein